MSFLTQKPKHYKDSEVIATRLGWELKETGEILSSFAFAGGLSDPVESEYIKKHGLMIVETDVGDAVIRFSPEDWTTTQNHSSWVVFP